MALNEIRYKGAAYAVDGDIWTSSGSWYETKSLKCDSLEANSFEVTVFDSDRAITRFRKNDKVEYFRDGRRMGIFYLQTVERVGPFSYHLSGLSAVGLLMTRKHNGGIYTGQTAGEVIRDICGDIPVKVESVYESRKLYGWLPYVQPSQSSARDNLAEVLFAIGAWLGVDNDGVLRVEKLWGGTASAIGPGLIHAEGCSVQYTDAVSAVEITEHQWVPSSDAVTLFEGTTEQGALIVFDDPAHDLTADGFTILESGANYAVVSAGSGTLTGQGYTHITRIIRKTVAEDAEENVVAITDAHLVSLTNSIDVANRTADYYRHRETIQVDINPLSGPPGNVVQIYHPWDKVMVSACIAERETTISGLLKSGIQALVGFTPPQPDASEYFDERVVLTGSGTWTPPEDAVTITAVLIGGGDGGGCGNNGHGPSKTPTVGQNYTINSGGPCYFEKGYGVYQHDLFDESLPPYAGQTYGGGEGGDPGAGKGLGGKVFRVTFEHQSGRSYSYSCGVGGIGGLKSAEAQAGASGTATTFDTFSSASGSQSDIGYTDPITGESFAKLGDAGIKGGNGGGFKMLEDGKDLENLPPENIKVGDIVYSGGTKGSGASNSASGNSTDSNGGYREYSAAGGFGGGAAYGAKGGDGKNGSGSLSTGYIRTTPGPGGDGADALPPPKQSTYGKGGTSGNGGGGGGLAGYPGTWVENRTSAYNAAPIVTMTVNNGTGGVAGLGSDGGEAGDGCIILYYSRRKSIRFGPLVTSGQKWLLDSLGRRIIV